MWQHRQLWVVAYCEEGVPRSSYIERGFNPRLAHHTPAPRCAEAVVACPLHAGGTGSSPGKAHQHARYQPNKIQPRSVDSN